MQAAVRSVTNTMRTDIMTRTMAMGGRTERFNERRR
jgi:hypothetical protein